MKRFFNISGPCLPEKHYMIPSEHRIKGLRGLIDQEQYFVIHAARQSGKTTLLKELTNRLNAEGKYYALYCSLESVQDIIEPEKGIPAVIYAVRKAVVYHQYLPIKHFADGQNMDEFSIVLGMSLTEFSIKLDKPLVILFDEADCLSNGTLISFLRQLRDGYVNRDMIPFVHSIGLIGMRNIRDYKGKIREERETLGSASPFNIVTKALTLKNFTKEEVAELYGQHTQETGQVFSADVIDSVYHYTGGQPWLVNAVARETVTEILESDHAKAICQEHVEKAVETIIKRRDTHIDSLLMRLQEKRVIKIVEPMLTGEEKQFAPLDDDLQFVRDLGLIKIENGRIAPSCPLYEEVMVRYLGMADRLDHQKYQLSVYAEKGKLDMKKLLTDFQNFWRENSAIWQEKFQYREAAPHLILMAFFQRILNTGGRIDREMATGRGRIDLCIHYENQRYPVEIKIRRDKNTLEEGKKQLSGYMDTLGCEVGWLVIFDRRKKTPWKTKLFWKTAAYEHRTVHAVGC
ncbi:MAG: AAA-like domain-containing protein [Desulfobacterales bacterium]